MTDYNYNLNATKHFLPDWHDMPDLSLELENRIRVGIIPAKIVDVYDRDSLPFEHLTTTWQWLNCQGILTREKFDMDIMSAVDHMARLINDANEPMRPYPITSKPGPSIGVCFHDFIGATQAIDIRFVIRYGQIPITKDVVPYGLLFNIVTLVQIDSYE